MKLITQAAVTAAAMTIVLGVGWQVHAEATRATLPDLDKLVHYTTVRRGNVTEHIMTTPQALEAVKNRQPVPPGTHFVLVDFRDGKLFRYFVMEKGEGWGGDYDERRRTGDWQYQWFWPDGKINAAENTARCASCHSSQASSDYLYTAYRIPRFNGKPVE